MTGINALSTRGAIMSTEDGSSFTGGSQLEADSAAMMFAAIFGGWMNQIGQGQDSGNQSYEPAGKEANSGRHALLGLDGLQGLMGILQENEDIQEVIVQGLQDQGQQGTNPEQLEILMSQLDRMRNLNAPSNSLGILEEVQLSGMTGEPQGNSPKSELDLYKNVISSLLKEMSGEIRVRSSNPADIQNLAQQKSELAVQRFNSGLFIAAVDSEVQGFPEMTDVEAPDMALRGMVAEDATTEDATTEDATTESVKSRGNSNIETNQTTSFAALLGKAKPSEFDTCSDEYQVKHRAGGNEIVGAAKNLEALSLNQEDSESDTLLKQETARNAGLSQGIGHDKLADEGALPSKETFAKVLQEKEQPVEATKTNKTALQEATVVGNILHQTKDISQVQGKVADKSEQPIWNQVARDIFDKAYLARPQLREMTIHLHPAHLGEINISMSWEEGQVHLRMVASEAGIGQLLQANLTELRDNLTQLGVQCGQMEMGLGEQKEGAQDHQGREGSARSQESGDESLELFNGEELEKMLNNEELIPGVNRINVRA